MWGAPSPTSGWRPTFASDSPDPQRPATCVIPWESGPELSAHLVHGVHGVRDAHGGSRRVEGDDSVAPADRQRAVSACGAENPVTLCDLDVLV
jgi:hypothetical protein